MASPRVVVVHRATEYEELLARHGTRGQAAFFLANRGGSLDELERQHEAQAAARAKVAASIPGGLATCGDGALRGQPLRVRT